MTNDRLEALRTALRDENISQDELMELRSLAEQIPADDVELLEAAGVPESVYRRGGFAEVHQQYLAAGGCCCPMCESSNIEGGSIEVDADGASQQVDCLDCGAEWTDFYQLQNVIFHEYGRGE